MFDCATIGGGIVGLATALTLVQQQPGVRVAVFEKEFALGSHQTGRNSGVIHSGIYYKPGSLKARLCTEGNRSMLRFCEEHGIAHERCGKVIVATERDELPQLEELYQRGLANGLDIQRFTALEVQQVEPHVSSLGGIRVPGTGIVDYQAVSRKYAELLESSGGELLRGTQVNKVAQISGIHRLFTTKGEFESRFLVNCAGLHSDRMVRAAGMKPAAQIVPFRGEYYELVPSKRHLAKSLIYPVPNPNFPFLGVHFTRMIDGTVHAGPNAVLAFKREGYRKLDFSMRDTCETLAFPGFWKLLRKHHSEAMAELQRSFSKRVFVQSLRRLIPELQPEDVVPAGSGVRAQAVLPTGALVDDFHIVQSPNSVHVCNAPSPAATASIEIGKSVVRLIPELISRPVPMKGMA